jgi:hypothetical protein
MAFFLLEDYVGRKNSGAQFHLPDSGGDIQLFLSLY